LAVGIVAVLLVASHAWSAKDPPSGSPIGTKRLASVQKQLRSRSEIYLRSLPARTTPKVSQSAAEATALKEFGRPLTSKVSSFAALDTDRDWAKRQPNGTIRFVLTDRPVWVVLLPNFTMMGYHGLTLCVFVDANTGKYLTGETIYEPHRADEAVGS